MTDETRLKNSLMLELKREFPTSHFWRTSGGPYAAPGVPDILGVIAGYAIGIEAKVNARKYGATPTQRAFGKKMIAAGGCWLLADDTTEVVRLLRYWLATRALRMNESGQGLENAVGGQASRLERDENDAAGNDAERKVDLTEAL